MILRSWFILFGVLLAAVADSEIQTAEVARLQSNVFLDSTGESAGHSSLFM